MPAEMPMLKSPFGDRPQIIKTEDAEDVRLPIQGEAVLFFAIFK